MSTYYSVVCDKHMERSDAASRSAGGIGPVGDSTHTLMHFLVKHCGCALRVVSEHEDDYDNEKYADWTENNVNEKTGSNFNR